MAAWTNLLVKELRLGRKFFFGGIIFAALMAVLAIGFAAYYPYGVASIMFFAGSLVIVFYLLAYLIISFSNERSSYSSWMQMPLPGWSLITAKIVAGLISMLITMIVVLLLTATVMAFDGEPDIMGLIEDSGGLVEVEITVEDMDDINIGAEIINYITDHYLQLTLAFAPFWIGAAIALAGWYLIYYFSRSTLNRWIGRWSILAGIAAVILCLRLYGLLEQSIVMTWFEWGTVPIAKTNFIAGDIILDLDLHTVYFGHLLFDLILVGLVVYACGWLLDKKVEVR